MSLGRMVFIATLLVLVSLGSQADPACSAKECHRSISSGTEEKACKFNDGEYQKVIKRISKTREFQELNKQLSDGDRIAFGGKEIDQPIVWRNRCFLSVSVYVNRVDRLELRLLFLADKPNGNLYLQDRDGNYHPVRQASSQKKRR